MITIDKEFQNLCPALLTDERIQLEENLKKDGCLSPLVVWGEILIDGHNRYEICTRLNIPFQTVQKSFESRDEVAEWIILNQFGRRNLRPEAHALLQGKLYLAQKKKIGDNQHNEKRVGKSYPPSLAEIRTSQEIADQTGTSEKTVRNNAKFAEAAEKLGIEADIMAGTETRNKAEIIAAAFPKPEEPLKQDESSAATNPETQPQKVSYASSKAKQIVGLIAELDVDDIYTLDAIKTIEEFLLIKKEELKKHTKQNTPAK